MTAKPAYPLGPFTCAVVWALSPAPLLQPPAIGGAVGSAAPAAEYSRATKSSACIGLSFERSTTWAICR